MTKVNLGVFTEIATEKADRDLRNVDLTKTDVIIEYQEPTEENGYTWYRLYASGWVEQGGIINSNTTSILLLVRMEDNFYNTIISYYKTNSSESPMAGHLSTNEQTTNSFTTKSSGYTRVWRVSGKADMTGHEILPSKKAIDEYDHRVIDFQKPTSENNYTWYRKYADGWVEQGGKIVTDSTTFPITFSQEPTITLAAGGRTSSQGGMYNISLTSLSASSFTVSAYTEGIKKAYWQASGLYATE